MPPPSKFLPLFSQIKSPQIHYSQSNKDKILVLLYIIDTKKISMLEIKQDGGITWIILDSTRFVWHLFWLRRVKISNLMEKVTFLRWEDEDSVGTNTIHGRTKPELQFDFGSVIFWLVSVQVCKLSQFSVCNICKTWSVQSDVQPTQGIFFLKSHPISHATK